MVKIGIISTAHGHADSYAAQVRAHPDAVLIGVWDDNAARRAQKTGEYDVPGFTEPSELLELCDAVIICSENVYHRAHVESAARAGKAILCEKPLATTPEDALAMILICEEHNVPLMTAFPCRFSAVYTSLKGDIQSGKLGELYAVCATNRGKCPGVWFVDKTLSGGGAVMDHTVHVADLLRDLLQSEAATVYCEAGNNMHHGDFDDCGLLTITFDNGVFATLDTSWSRPASFPTWGDVTMNITGSNGVLTMDMFAQESVLYDGASGVQNRNWGSNIDKGMVGAFVAAMRDKTPVPVTGQDGLRAVEIVYATYESVRTGQPTAVVHL